MSESLKTIRKNANLTQPEAANYLNVSLRSYKTYENDESKIKTIKYEYMLERLKELNFIYEEHGLLTVEKIIEVSREILDKYPVHYSYLFGSYAKGTETEVSDVDLLISSDVRGLEFFGLVEELKNGLKKNVDALDLNQLANNMDLVNEILRDGIRIYG